MEEIYKTAANILFFSIGFSVMLGMILFGIILFFDESHKKFVKYGFPISLIGTISMWVILWLYMDYHNIISIPAKYM